ncbi:MAG: MFS transporter [Akkermansiaceae bacterium]
MSNTQSSQSQTTVKLSVMMFLEFFIWGAWFVTIGVYLRQGMDFSAGLGTAYSVGPIAAIISPLFLGLFADRFLPTQIVLGICHLVGAVLLLLVPWSVQQELDGSNGVFFWVLIAYMLFYMPTLGLTNSLAMSNVENTEKQFPVIRVFGTIGWIAAGFLVGTVLKADATDIPFKVAAGASLVLGVFSFFLPHTPPPQKGQKVSAAEALGLGALGMLKDFRFLIFALASMLICIPLQAYYAYTATFMGDAGFESPSGSMIWGQISEIVFMLIIPFLFRRLGVKWMLSIGMACWVLRYVLFAVAAPEAVIWMIFGGVLLHGICYDFFFVTGQIYTDQKAPKTIRGQAQALLVVLTQGVGMFIGAKINQAYFEKKVGVLVEEKVLDTWPDFWWMPAGLAAAILLVFMIFFKNDSEESQS